MDGMYDGIGRLESAVAGLIFGDSKRSSALSARVEIVDVHPSPCMTA